MLVLSDANYRAIWAHVDSPGCESDCGIYTESALCKGAMNDTLNFPPPEPLPNDNQDTRYFFIGDDAFPLREYMLKPYAQRYLDDDKLIFNYRLSRARRVVENLFGIMAKRFRCLLGTLEVQAEKAVAISKACLVLHNLLRDRYGVAAREADEEDENHQVVPGAWRTDAVMREVDEEHRAPRANAGGQAIRTTFKAYFNSEAGSVPWQRRLAGLPEL